MLRIDPAYPLLWRSTATVQLGPDAAVIIEIDHPWQLALLRELVRGIPESAVEPVAEVIGVPHGGADALIARLDPVLTRTPVVVPPEVALLRPTRGAPAADDVVTGIELAGLPVRLVTDDAVRDGWRGPVVVIAHHVLDLRRVAPLMSHDLPHVPIVFTGTGSVVGPVVVPGATACASCIALARRDADPAWPAIAAQLLAFPPAPAARADAVEAGIAAVRLMSGEATDRRWEPTVSVELSAHRAHRTTTAHRVHAECGCRSLAGSGKAGVLATLEPTRPTAYARPA
jgi:hypothetical protein